MSYNELLREAIRVAVETAKKSGMLPVYIAQILSEQAHAVRLHQFPNVTEASLSRDLQYAINAAWAGGLTKETIDRHLRDMLSDGGLTPPSQPDAPKRKIVQVCDTPDRYGLHVLCDDGTVWTRDNAGVWCKINLSGIVEGEE